MRKTLIAMLLALPLTALAASPQTVVLDMQNMTCSLCSVTVKKALEKVPGVATAQINYDKKTATVQFDPEKMSACCFVMLFAVEWEKRPSPLSRRSLPPVSSRASFAGCRVTNTQSAAALQLLRQSCPNGPISPMSCAANRTLTRSWALNKQPPRPRPGRLPSTPPSGR